MRGPHLTGAAIDCGERLVDNLQDARLQWVAEEPIGGGKGGGPKVAFGFYPANFSGWGYAHYSAPVVADGKVYLYVLHPDREQARSDPAVADQIIVKRGADPEVAAKKRHAVFCFDARTGKTLWRWMSAPFDYHGPSGKSGIGVTPCVIGDRLFVRVQGITCFDANDGAIIWQRKEPGYGTWGGWSHEESLVSIGGVLLAISQQRDLIGIDPETGAPLWQHEKVTGPNQLAARVVLDGKEYALVAAGSMIGKHAEPVISLIEPRSGKIIWQDTNIGVNAQSLLVDRNIVCGNAVKVLKNKNSPHMAAGYNLSLDGVKRLWEAKQTGYPQYRFPPVAKDGYFYIDSRRTGFQALEAATGTVVNRHPHIYRMTPTDHNWTWQVATDNRIVTSGLLLFTTADEGFKRLPGRLSQDLVNGYMCPVKPAIADGRLFIRSIDRLLCYDLRRPEDLHVDSLKLTIDNPMLGYPADAWDGELGLRIIRGALSASYTTLPSRNQQGTPLLSAPGYAPADTLTLNTDDLSGSIALRVGHHEERWAIDARRDADAFEGTCTRRVEPLTKPLSITGKIDGKIEKRDDGATWWIVSCLGGASQRPDLTDFQRKSAHLIVATFADGSRHSWARASKVNTATHEVDATGLEITETRATGTVTVIYHGDRWAPGNPETGGPLAATYTIDASIADGKITGTYKGVLGVALTRKLPIKGTYAANKDLHE